MPELGEISARLTADGSTFTAGMGQAKTAVENFQTAAATATAGTKTFYEGVAQAGEFAGGSERGIRRMEFALGSLAAEATGANHALGTLIEGLLLFGSGSVLTVAALAGIAAIAVAFKEMDRGWKDTEADIDKLGKSLDALGPHAKLVAEQIKLAFLQAKGDAEGASLGFFDEIVTFWANVLRGLPNAPGADDLRKLLLSSGAQTQLIADVQLTADIADQQEKVNLAAEEYQKKLTEGNDRLQERLDGFLDQIAIQQSSVRFQDEFRDAVRDANAEVKALNSEMELWTKFGADLGEVMFQGQRFSLGKGEDNTLFGQISKTVEESNRQMDKILAEQERHAKEWGMRISRALVDGISGNLNSLGALLKSIIEEWINVNIITPFIVSLGIFSPSRFGMYVGQMLAEGVAVVAGRSKIGVMGLALTVNVSGGSPDPFTAARDNAWQRTLRESILVANQQGFKAP